MNFYRSILRPLLFRLQPETAHELAIHLLAGFSRAPWLLRSFFGPVPDVPVELCGLRFPNPIGLAAGMDKNAVALPAWAALGFGFVEAGTITALPQPGNPKPRVFRYPQQGALVNRMGFNNEGCEAVGTRLEALRKSGRWPAVPVGLNLGKSKVTPLEEAPADYRKSFLRLRELGDYFVINVSSPNTPGLRSLQTGEQLAAILETLRAAGGPDCKPLWVKLAPDLTPEEAAVSVRAAENSGADALILTNTTLDHSALPSERNEEGGLSGNPLREKARLMLEATRSMTSLPLIASGGIMSPEDAVSRREAGASLVQLYTGFVYEGPGLVQASVRAIRASSPFSRERFL